MVKLVRLTVGLFGLLVTAITLLMAPAPQPTSWIIFTSSRDGNANIYRMRTDGRQQQRLTASPAQDYSPQVSPNGQWIIFVSDRDSVNGDIYRMRTDGGDLKRLTYTPYAEWVLGWSPDGQWIVFRAGWIDTPADYQMRVNGTNQQPLRTSVTSQQSPDRQWIVASLWRDGTIDIFKRRIDGTGEQRLTTSPAYECSPLWSPDGQWILFMSELNDSCYYITRIRPNGTDRQYLTGCPKHGALYGASPQWSPDGQWIAFVSDRDGNDEIYRMRADGSEQQNLTNYPLGDDQYLQWSPDGQWIAFESDRDGNDKIYNDEIYRMRADGSEQQRLTSVGGSNPQWALPLRRVWHPWRLLGICGSLVAVVLVPKSKTLMRRRGK